MARNPNLWISRPEKCKPTGFLATRNSNSEADLHAQRDLSLNTSKFASMFGFLSKRNTTQEISRHKKSSDWDFSWREIPTFGFLALRNASPQVCCVVLVCFYYCLSFFCCCHVSFYCVCFLFPFVVEVQVPDIELPEIWISEI